MASSATARSRHKKFWWRASRLGGGVTLGAVMKEPAHTPNAADRGRLGSNPGSAKSLEAWIEAEYGWVQSLARSLVRDEASAADLTQDAVSAALRQRPEMSGARLKGWFRTVMRRRASRLRRNRVADRVAEKRGAAAMDLDLIGEVDASEERLILQGRLTEAIRALDPEDRFLVVGRFIEGRSAADLAREAGIAPSAARQRLGRALQKLRRDLEADDRRWADWLPALAGLGVPLPDGSSTTLTSSGSGSLGLPLTASLAMLKLSLLAAAAIITTLLVWPDPGGPSLVPAPEAVAADAALINDLESAAAIDQGAREALVAVNDAPSPPAPSTEPPSSPQADLLLVDTQGAIIPGGFGLWLHTSGEVSSFDFNGAKGSARPTQGGGFLVAYARGFLAFEGQVPAATGGQPHRIELTRAPPIRFRFVEGGVPTDETVPITIRSWRDQSTLLQEVPALGSEWDRRMQGSMFEEVNVKPGEPHSVAPIFRRGPIEVALPDHVNVKPSKVPARAEGRKLLLYSPPPTHPLANSVFDIEVEFAPQLELRLTWEDTGAPFIGSAMGFRRSSTQPLENIRTLKCTTPGHFTLGLMGAEGFFGDRREPRWPDEAELELFLLEEGGDHLTDARSHRIALPNPASPPDFIDVRIPRDRMRRIRVVTGQGSSTRGLQATAQSGVNFCLTDQEGYGEIAASLGETIAVLADGYFLKSIEVTPENFGGREEAVITMTPGPLLRVKVESSEAGARPPFGIRIVSSGPLADARDCAGDVEDYETAFNEADMALIAAWSRDRDRGISFTEMGDGLYIDMQTNEDGELSVPGLRGDAPLTVEWTDRVGRALDSKTIQLSESMTVSFGGDAEAAGSLRVSVEDSSGLPLQAGLLQVMADRLPAVVPVIGGVAAIPHLSPGNVSLSAWRLGGERPTEQREEAVVRAGAETEVTLTVE